MSMTVLERAMEANQRQLVEIEKLEAEIKRIRERLPKLQAAVQRLLREISERSTDATH